MGIYKLYLFLLLLSPIASFPQIKRINNINVSLKNLISETSKIMDILHISKRVNLKKDSPSINVLIDSTVLPFNAFFGGLHKNERGVITPSGNHALRYYRYPAIRMNPLLHLIVSKKKDTTAFVRLKAISIFVHELVHYLQATWWVHNITVTSYDQMESYISQPDEFEAYGAEAYFLLKYYNEKLLSSIMYSKNTQETKMKLLIKSYYSTVYPWRAKIF